MILLRCVNSFHVPVFDPDDVIMTTALGTLYFSSGKSLKQGISSVVLIGISATAGMNEYAVV